MIYSMAERPEFLNQLVRMLDGMQLGDVKVEDNFIDNFHSISKQALKDSELN